MLIATIMIKKFDNEFKKWKVWMGSCSGPVLEFKESIHYVQKGHLTLMCFFQTDESISGNRFKQVFQLQTLSFMVYCSFYNLSFPLVDSENTWWWRKGKFRDFLLLWFLKDLQKCQKQIVKSTERILKKFCNGSDTLLGQRRNASCFVIFRINHFQKNKHSKENTTS